MTWALPTIAVALLAYAAVSGRLEGTPITAPIVFTAVGLLVGVDALGLVDPSISGEPVKLLAEATLALVLFGDASRIDLAALREEVSIPARLLGLGDTHRRLRRRHHAPRGALVARGSAPRRDPRSH